MPEHPICVAPPVPCLAWAAAKGFGQRAQKRLVEKRRVGSFQRCAVDGLQHIQKCCVLGLASLPPHGPQDIAKFNTRVDQQREADIEVVQNMEQNEEEEEDPVNEDSYKCLESHFDAMVKEWNPGGCVGVCARACVCQHKHIRGRQGTTIALC